MKISMIAAMARNRTIGKDNDLPWHLPDDFKYFQRMTKGHHVLMGRKNYDSLPERFRPLPDRTNIVLSKNSSFEAPGTVVFQSMQEAISYARQNNEEELFIIGGGIIYELGLPIADCIYLTEIDADVEGHTFFPLFDKSDYREVSRDHHPADNRHQFAFDFVVYQKA